MGSGDPAEELLARMKRWPSGGVVPALHSRMATAIMDLRVWAMAVDVLERQRADSGGEAADGWTTWLEWAELVAVLAAFWQVKPDGWCDGELEAA